MPHLCPMSWPLAFLVFWSTLLLITSLIWWHQLPTFPPIPVPSTKNYFSPWKWY